MMADPAVAAQLTAKKCRRPMHARKCVAARVIALKCRRPMHARKCVAARVIALKCRRPMHARNEELFVAVESKKRIKMLLTNCIF